MKTAEVWKPIKGYKGLYEVSNHGRVKSLPRVVKRENGSNGSSSRSVQERILKHWVGNGYAYVVLCKNKIKKQISIHILVANAFIENKPKKCKYQTMHLDGNRLNNNAYNLRFGSQLCNAAFMIDDGTSMRGEKNVHSKLSRNDVRKIRKLYKKGSSSNGYNALGRRFGVSGTSIHSIIVGKNWGWLD